LEKDVEKWKTDYEKEVEAGKKSISSMMKKNFDKL
jgi:hypothetical protein